MSDKTKMAIIDIIGALVSAVVILLVFAFVNSNWDWLTSQDVNAKFDRIGVVLVWLTLNGLSFARRYI